MINKGSAIFSLDRVKPSYFLKAEEDFGIRRANSRTHNRYLRKHKLGKFKKKWTK